jgi:RNA polymerase sigma-70 factor (ECF subfamily)
MDPSPPNPTPRPEPGDGEDRALLARIARDDRSALEQLYRRHAPWLTSRLESRCGDPDLADLALQDTFVAVWRSAGRYRGDGQVAAWLWGIAVRRLIDQLRRRRPTPVAAETLDRYDRAMTFEDALIDSGAHGPVGAALRSIEPELQAVLIATAIDGLSTREAARMLAIPQGTVKTRLQRARRRLQEILT